MYVEGGIIFCVSGDCEGDGFDSGFFSFFSFLFIFSSFP